MSSVALQFVSGECISRCSERDAMPIEISPYGQIRRADFVDKEPKITSMPIQSGTAEKMTALLLK